MNRKTSISSPTLVATSRRKLITAATLAGAAQWLPTAAFSQAWPSKPIRLVVPFPAGGGADVAARVLAGHLANAVGQSVLVENRAGADGVIAAQEVIRSAPDGHTIFFGTASSMSYVPSSRKTPPYDPIADFTPLTDFCTFTFFWAVHESVPARNMDEFVKYARANPGKVSYGTGNSTGIVATAQLAQTAKLDMTHVPYKGEAQAAIDLGSGRIQAMFATPAITNTLMRDGKVKLLAVLLPQRSQLQPDVPTMAEAGQPLVDIKPWGAFFGPAKLPEPIVNRLSQELNTIIKRPDMRESMDKNALAVHGSTPAELAAFVKGQLASWGKTIREAKLMVD
jgi:tripartite-type tricarboxylate transporter receptor subunit TctC